MYESLEYINISFKSSGLHNCMMGTLTVYLRSRRMLTYVYVYISDTSLGEQYTDSQGANTFRFVS